MSIEALRAKLREAQTRNEKRTTSRGGGDKASFPFWDTPVGQTSTIRFLPDLDPDNLFFWVERQVIKLPFDGVVGGDKPTTDRVEVTVPCVDMFNLLPKPPETKMACPIIAATRHLWDGSDADKEVARTYYKKRSYIFQGLVVNSPIVEEEAPENPIRRFVINKSIYDIVYASLLEPNFESMPTDFDGGRDFKITKTQKGDWANYGTSNWSYNTRSLSEAERAAIEQHKLHDLKSALGAIPDADHMAAIKAMFEASFAGEPYDFAAFGNYYRPYGHRASGGNNGGGAANTTEQTTTAAAALAETETTSAGTEAAASSDVTSKQNAEDIIARLRAKSAQR